MALLLLCGVGVGVSAVELLARLLFPDAVPSNILLRLENAHATWARPDPNFHHVGDGIYRLNFPNPSEAPVPPRIAIVGDSFAMGHIVGEQNRFGHILQEHLGRVAKVDILASSGYSPIIYRNVIEKAFSLAFYRAVVVFVDQTDPVEELIYQEDAIEEDGVVTFNMDQMTSRQHAIDAAYADLLKRLSKPTSVRQSAIVNLLMPPSLEAYFKSQDKHYRYVRMSVHRRDYIKQFNADPKSKDSEKMLSLLTRHLEQIVSECRTRRTPIFLAANPWEFQTSPRPRVTRGLPGPFPKENRLELFLMSKFRHMPDVHVIPLTRTFREYADPSRLFIDNPADEFHWNEEGHKLVEEILRQELLARFPDLKASR
jgi:hypothetical protein